MSFLYYILSLQNPCQSKLDNKREPSILIEVLFAMKIDVKTNSLLIKNLLYRHEIRPENEFGNEYLVLYSP